MTDFSSRAEADYGDLLRRVGVPLALVGGGALLVSAGAARFVTDALVAIGLSEGNAWSLGVVVAAAIPFVVFVAVLRSLEPTQASRRNGRMGAALALVAAAGYAVAPADAALALGGLAYVAGFVLALGAIGQTVLREDETYATRGISVQTTPPPTNATETQSSMPADGGTERRSIERLDDE